VHDQGAAVSQDVLSDEQLVEQARTGSSDAFCQLVVRYQDKIVSLVATRINDRDAAQDITQEVMIKAYRGLKSFKAESKFYTWLYRIAINTTSSYRRKERRRPATLSFGAGESDDRPSLDPADPSEGPSNRAEVHEDQDLLRAAVANLEEDFQQALVLRDFQGLAYEEIAEILQVPVGSVKSRIHRARKKLAESLREPS